MKNHSRERVSTAPESMAASFTPLQPKLGLAHGDLRLVYGCSAMETHFMRLPTNNYCAGIASRDSLELQEIGFHGRAATHKPKITMTMPSIGWSGVKLAAISLCSSGNALSGVMNPASPSGSPTD